jgi:hypothetical protein
MEVAPMDQIGKIKQEILDRTDDQASRSISHGKVLINKELRFEISQIVILASKISNPRIVSVKYHLCLINIRLASVGNAKPYLIAKKEFRHR